MKIAWERFMQFCSQTARQTDRQTNKDQDRRDYLLVEVITIELLQNSMKWDKGQTNY